MSFYRFARSGVSLALRVAVGFAVFFTLAGAGATLVVIVIHPDFVSGGHLKKLPGLAKELTEYAALGGAMIWLGRKLRYLAFPKADKKSAASAEWVLYGSGAPVWVDALAVSFVSLGFLGLMYLTSDYNPSGFVSRLIMGVGVVYLLPRLWLALSNDAAKDLRWKLRPIFPDTPLMWDTGTCLCANGQQIPWAAIDTVLSRSARFKRFITIKTRQPSECIEVDVTFALQSPDVIERELTTRRHKRIADIRRAGEANELHSKRIERTAA